jgi:hypothetical protein
VNSGFLILAVVGCFLLALVLIRSPGALRPAIVNVRRQLLMIFLRMPFALITAAYLGLLIPPDGMAPFIGSETGLAGVVLAVLFGSIIPGGPIMMFPLALVLWRGGAGDAQMVALLMGWTIIALHRSLSFEIPLVGVKFAVFRLASSWMMPFLSGVLALLLLQILPRLGG